MSILALTICAEVSAAMAGANLGLAMFSGRRFPIAMALLGLAGAIYFTARTTGWSL